MQGGMPMQTGMQLETIEDPGAEWDDFVRSTPGGALGHAAVWARILREGYALEPHYLAARNAAGALAGVLPLVPVRSLSGRRDLVSLPFLDSGGILTGDDEAERTLLEGALALAREMGAGGLELRQLSALRNGPAPPEQHRVDLVLPLEASEEGQWKALRAKVRNQTRKAERAGLAPECGAVGSFYGPFAVNMRDLGSPAHSRRFFEVAADAWGSDLSVHLALLDGRSVGGLVAIEYAGTVTVPWAATLREERARCPNNLIYWEALRWAICRGARLFDFGRSPLAGGTYRFKVGWGATERPLAWTRLGVDGAPLPAGSGEPPALLRRVSSLWSRLPVGLATSVGSRLRRHLSN